MAPEEFNLFLPMLIQARFALVPPGFREPELNWERLSDAYNQSVRFLFKETTVFAPKTFLDWMDKSRQPALALLLGATLIDGFHDMPARQKPSPNSQMTMLVALRHMIDELDQSIRE